MKKKLAILATDGFEEIELTSSKKALEDVGIEVHIISPNKDSIKAWNNNNWSDSYQVDKHISDVQSTDYQDLMLPG